MFITSNSGRNRLVYAYAMGSVLGKVYFWGSYVISFALPFVLLLAMNTAIIHTLRKRSASPKIQRTGCKVIGEGQGQTQKAKFRIPDFCDFTSGNICIFNFYNTNLCDVSVHSSVDYKKQPYTLAAFHLFFSVGQKLFTQTMVLISICMSCLDKSFEQIWFCYWRVCTTLWLARIQQKNPSLILQK